jgi:phage-related minor tail protein
MAEAIKGLNIKLGLDTTELESSIKSLNSDLKEQQRDLAAINKNLKYDSSNVDLWKQKQSKLNEVLQTTKKKLDEQKKALDVAREGVKLGTVSEQEFNKMQRAIQYTEAEIAKLNKELKETEGKISSLGSVNVEKLSAIGSAMTKYITAPVTAAVTALSALALSPDFSP